MYIVNLFSKKWAEVDSVNRIMERSAIYTQLLDEWQYEKFDYLGVNQYHKLLDGVIRLGEMWDMEGTYFFRRNVEIPSLEKAMDWYIEFDIGGENEVYVDDIPMGSIDTEHHEVLMAAHTAESRVLPVKIQAARHAHDYVRIKRSTGKEYGCHIFRKVRLVARNRTLVEFCSLATVLLQLMDCDLLSEELCEVIHEILKKVLYEIDYYAEMDTLETQVSAGQKRLLAMIHSLRPERTFGNSIFMGHSHLDLAFKWTYRETYRKIERTLSNAVCLMERYPDVTYVQSQMHIIETLATGYPELFQRVRKLVSGGKLEVVGDVYVEFDTNIPSGESLIRQFLLGKAIANDLTGTNSKVCFLPDTFGYSGILPQIMRQAGYEYFVTAKLSWNDTNKPQNLSFLWTGIDGSSIKTHLIDSYGGNPDPTRLNDQCKDKRYSTMPNGDCHIYQYGAGDGGGGISEDNILTIQSLDQLKVFTKVHQMTLEQAMEVIFRDVSEDALPVSTGELYFENHRGVYTSQERIKKGNRGLELALQKTEVMNTLAYLQGHPYDREELNRVWKKLLLNQFHDIIAGSCISQVAEEAERDFKQGIEACNSIVKKVIGDLETGGSDITIFNPLGIPSDNVVKVRLPYPVQEIGGRAVQLVPSDDGECWGLVNLESIPAFGNRKYCLGEKAELTLGENRDTNTLENGRYRIRFDENGDIAELYDKLQKRQVLRGKGNVFSAHVDRGGYFESWNVTADIERKVYPVETVEHMCLIEEGPVRRTLKVIKTFRQSTIIQNISIYEDSPRIDFHTEVDFQEQQMLLKAGFDVDVDAPVATYDISMGDLTRPTTRNNSFERARFEVNTHKFVDLSAEDYGVAILNDCKYGCDVAGNRMRITLIKTATFPDENQDIGLHEFCYSLYPHTGDVKQGGVREVAYRLNQPPCTILGNLTLPEEPVLCEDMGIMMEALKKAEREEAVILRLYEHHGREREIRIRWNLPMSGVRKCNVLEQELEDDVRLDGQDIYLLVKPYEIVTLKIFQ